jgi:hypothetical protein
MPQPSEMLEPPIGYIHSTRPIPLGFNDFLAQARHAIDNGRYYTLCSWRQWALKRLQESVRTSSELIPAGCRSADSYTSLDEEPNTRTPGGS